ncbi:Hypothetical protein FKW44_021091, partial [Caligus rogercresseyi]
FTKEPSQNKSTTSEDTCENLDRDNSGGLNPEDKKTPDKQTGKTSKRHLPVIKNR